MDPSNAASDAFILRVDLDLGNEIYYHWGGYQTNDVAEAVKVDLLGRWIYVMGEYESPNSLDS